MLSEPRSISLILELVHLPVTHVPEKLREVYNEVCRTCDFENFTRIPGGARIERKDPEGEGFSQLTFSGDRIQLVEDHTGMSIDEFGKRGLAVLASAMPKLGIPILLVQQNTVRITANPNGYRSASEYLARSIFRFQAEDLEVLSRPVHLFGFRLAFPATVQHPVNYNTRVEGYVRDPRSLYVETVATFKTPIQAAQAELVHTNLTTTAAFVVDRVLPFLSQFDRREVTE